MNTQKHARGGFHSPLQQLILLEERVRQAGVSLPDASQDLAFHGLKCVVDGRNCVMNLKSVAEVLASRPVAAVPGTAAWVEGVFNYRGVLVPVYRIDCFFRQEQDMAPQPARTPGNSHLVVLRKAGRGNEFNAVRVDSLHGMQKFREAELLPLPQMPAADGLAHYARCGVGSGEWLLLDVDRLMARINTTLPFPQQEPPLV